MEPKDLSLASLLPKARLQRELPLKRRNSFSSKTENEKIETEKKDSSA